MISVAMDPDRLQDVFVFPASFAQQRLWFLEQLTPGTSRYHVPTVFRLTGILNRAAMAQSFQAIVARHEVLRTTFDMLDGQLVQVIAPELSLSLPLVDMQHIPAIDREAEALALVWQTIEQPFNFTTGPLLRLLLIRLNDTDHILLINLHHIVFDEWSSGVLIQELSAFYTAFIANAQVDLPELSIQYADFAHWQRECLQEEVLQSQLAYWQQQLTDVPPLQLPSDLAHPLVQRDRGASQLLELPQALLEALESISQQAEVTLFMTLLAAFQTLLHRYSEQTDIVVGSPIANRNHSDLESLIGFFVNSLVFRTDLSGDPTFRQLLERVRTVALEAYAHQDLPFEKLVEALHPDRNLSRNPLFQVVFALQNSPMQQLELPGLSLSSLKFQTNTVRFDLELYLWICSENFRNLWGNGWNHSDGLRGVVVYNTDLFTAETIGRLCQHFQVLLEGIVANPDVPLSALPLLTATEQQQIASWNQTETPFPADRTLMQLFEEHVQQTPNAIAVQFANQSFTYQALNTGSNQLAHYLQQMGVGRGTIVGLWMEASPQAIAGMLGILKAGGAYLPLDPACPPDRLRFLLHDAQVSVILTCQPFAEWLKDCGATVICLDYAWETIAQAQETNPPSDVTSDDLAYVIYTSGSTGTPKGVMVPHRAIVRLVRNTNYITIDPSDKVAQVSNLAFDAATFEIWGALLNGAQIVGIDRHTVLDPPRFAAHIQRETISILFLTTALLNQIACDVPTAFGALKYLLFGGEAVDPRWVRSVVQHGKPQHLLHVYGPTENTTFTTWYEVESVPETATTLPIGQPIANTHVYVLDSHLNPVPIGIKGELYLAGEGLAQGYLSRLDLTIERFIEHNCQSLGNNKAYQTMRLYKTGDLGRYRSDGNLEFLGRTDHQVKLRGFRIELGEIETTLMQYPVVQDAIVMLQKSDTSPQLVAYLVVNQVSLQSATDQAHDIQNYNSHQFIAQLRTFLKSKLPSYMMPAAWVVLDAFPLTANGKVDRQALPFTPVLTKDIPVMLSQTSVAAKLLDLWRQLLGREQIELEDNFFELGGHSLLATQLVTRIRQVFQLDVPLRCLFEMPTIAELAVYIESLNND